VVGTGLFVGNSSLNLWCAAVGRSRLAAPPSPAGRCRTKKDFDLSICAATCASQEEMRLG
jgi:hypothetical protein